MKETSFYTFLVKNIRLPYTASEEEIRDTAIRRLARRLPGGEVVHAGLYRTSYDCRKKPLITVVCSVLVTVRTTAKAAERVPDGAGGDFEAYEEEELTLRQGTEPLAARPVVVGFGPCGMFAALLLAEAGYRPIVLERGADVEERTLAVRRFRQTGVLDPDTNVQFGAGGAGTFSDGKLTTRIHDPLCRYVLRRFAEFGAPETVLTDAKPHVGTDVLAGVVAALRDRVTSLGGEIRFRTAFRAVTEEREGYLRIRTTAGEIEAGALILAPGHSARDLYAALLKAGWQIEAKQFSVGVRIEHLQEDLNRDTYGAAADDERLPAADYHVSYREGERGVYSFCMCPGGEVVAAASEEGGVVVNGMSNSRRDGKNANAALAVSVLPGDFGNDPYGAVAFQKNLERAAFTAGGGNYDAPAQTVGDFLDGKSGTEPTRVLPTYRDGAVRLTDLSAILPPFVSSMLKVGIGEFARRYPMFTDRSAILTGVETRTSAPVRILRNADFTALGHSSVYPCGEGAGYAGGITSAAVDGLRAALAVAEKYAPPKD